MCKHTHPSVIPAASCHLHPHINPTSVLCVLEIYPLEECIRVPSGTSQGLTHVSEAALRKWGSEACQSLCSLSTASCLVFELTCEAVLIELLSLDVLLLKLQSTFMD